jgi:hypothetical protein
MRRTLALAVLAGAALLALPTSGAVWSGSTTASGTAGSRQPIRVTTYEIGAGMFGGTDYTLPLRRDLSQDYFVMIRGSAGDGQVNSRPSSDSVRVVGDPYRLTPATNANQLRLHRETTTTGNNQQSDWRGTVTVVESPDSNASDGFRLVDVVEIGLTASTPSASRNTSVTFDATRTVPFGGVRGGGVTTSATGNDEYRAQWARLWLSGSAQVNAEGSGIPSGDSATYTIYVVEWGSRWTVHHAFGTGSQGGNGLDTTSEYTQIPLGASVPRAQTWVIAFGNTTGASLGGGWQGHAFTLGNGVVTNATENQVAVGSEAGSSRRVDVYTMTHPNLAVTHVFGPDGTIPSNADTGSIAVPGPLGPESRTTTGVATTEGTRLAILTNGSNGGGNAYPRPILWTRHQGDTAMVWRRARTGQQGVFWAQSVDFGAVWR